MNIDSDFGNTLGTQGNTIAIPSSSNSNWKTIMVVVIIIILAIFGLNIFVYLAKGTDLVTYILEKGGSLLKQIMGAIGQGTERTVDLTKVGVTEVVGTKKEKKDLDETLDKKKPDANNVVANSTDAKKIQSGNKKGWCYVGTDRDYRSCLKVNADDTCTSGEIFDSKQKCEHPELRYD